MVLRWRDFGVFRWSGLVLVLLGTQPLFEGSTWWAGALLVAAGLGLIVTDSARLRRTRERSAEDDKTA
jgi:hypothetical protein